MLHIPRKRFGQHFLTDQSVIDKLVALINPQPGQFVVEIGPGQAALTQPLVERLGRMTVIELDRDLAERLRQHPHLDVIEADVLQVRFAEFLSNTEPQKIRIVGNLPYNISTPILFHLLEYVDVVQDQHFMLQKEVVERMVALPSTAEYGRLSVMLQWRYKMENILAVPPTSFRPPPRVDSAVVRMQPHSEFEEIDVHHLSQLVKVAFSQRRKLLRHSLGRWLEEQKKHSTFDLQRRAEEVTVQEYIALARDTAQAALNQ
jgi:16S rRNA (adenine1518-N6/adenine1519-N6)-dimethyltransferase